MRTLAIEQNPTFEALEQGRDYKLYQFSAGQIDLINGTRFAKLFQLTFACPPHYIYVTAQSSGDMMQLMPYTWNGGNSFPSYCGATTTWTIPVNGTNTNESSTTLADIAVCSGP